MKNMIISIESIFHNLIMDFSKEYEWGNKLRPMGEENYRVHEWMDVPMFLESHGIPLDRSDPSRTASWVKGFNRSAPEQKKGWYRDADLGTKRDVALEFQYLGDYRSIGMDSKRTAIFDELVVRKWYDPRLESHPTWRLEAMKNSPEQIAEAIVESGFDAVVRSMVKKPYKYEAGIMEGEWTVATRYDPDLPVNPEVPFPPRRKRGLLEDLPLYPERTYMEDSMRRECHDCNEKDEPFPFQENNKVKAAAKQAEKEKIDMAVERLISDILDDGLDYAIPVFNKLDRMEKSGYKNQAAELQAMYEEDKPVLTWNRVDLEPYMDKPTEQYTLW